jgi:hypothetical protein
MAHPNSFFIFLEIARHHEVIGRIIEPYSATGIFIKRGIHYAIIRAILERDAIQIADEITIFYPILHFLIGTIL